MHPFAISTSMPLIRGEPSRRSVAIVRCLRVDMSSRTRDANSGSAASNSAQDAMTYDDTWSMSRAVEELNRRMLRARDAIDRAYAQPLDIPNLCQIAFVSEAHFIRTLRADFRRD